MADWRDELARWLAPFVERFGHKARRRMCPLYVAGLIGPGDRKSVGPMAERVAPGDYDRLHHFVSDGVWDEAPLERELAIQADKLVGGAGAFLVIDDTTLPKKGTHSVGVAPQYASALGGASKRGACRGTGGGVVAGSSFANAERSGSRRGARGNLSSLDGFGRRAGRAASTATGTSVTGVEAACLPVFGGIILSVVGKVGASDDPGGRPRREINLLIGVAAGEDKRRDHDRNAEPHGRFPTHWSRPVGRSFGRCAGEVDHQVLLLSAASSSSVRSTVGMA